MKVAEAAVTSLEAMLAAGRLAASDMGPSRAAVAGLAAGTGSNTRQLALLVKGGRAFTSHLHTEPPAGATQHYVLHAMFDKQRFRSAAVPVAVEPQFDCTFVLDLAPPDAVGMASLEALMAWRSPVHFSITCVTQ